MIIDAQNLFSDAQTITTGSENGIKSSNVIDLGSARDVGAGEPVFLVVQVDTAMEGSGVTCTVDLKTDDNESMSSSTKIAEVGVFPANSVAGTRLIMRLPPSSSYERYLGLLFTASGSGLTAGDFSAFLTKDVDAIRQYPKGYSIQ